MARELIPHPQALGDALAEELARVLGGRLGGRGRATRVDSAEAIAWVVPARLDGMAGGTLTAGFTAEGAQALAAALGVAPARDHTAGDHAVMTSLHGVVVDAVNALADRSICEGLDLSAGTARRAEPAILPPEAGRYHLDVDAELAVTVWCWATLDAMSRNEEAAQPGGAAPPSVPTPAGNLDVVLDIDLPLTVRFGDTDMTLEALTRIGPGTIVDLGRSPDGPVDVLVNGRLVARGTVVVVGGNYGVRVTEVVSTSDRVRSIGA